MIKTLKSMITTQMTIINDNMINLHKLPPKNDNLHVHQTQTISKVSHTPSTSIEPKYQQNIPSTQGDINEDPNMQEPPNSINDNLDDDISLEDKDNSDDDLIYIDTKKHQNNKTKNKLVQF